MGSAITQLRRNATRIAKGGGKIRPGEPFVINAAASVGDGVWQGDLGIEIVSEIPEGYVPRGSDADSGRQLVPGQTQGSRHCLGRDVEQFVPRGWGPSYEGLMGPAFVCDEETSILHPTHGAVVIAEGHIILTRYQRNLDEETKRERRAID